MLQTLPIPTKTWMPRLSFAPKNTAPRGDTLVVVFLRGAADVLNMIVPHGEEAYYQLRPTLGIARPDDSRKKKEERVYLLYHKKPKINQKSGKNKLEISSQIE